MKIIKLLRCIILLAIIVTLSNTIVAQVSVRVGAGFPDYFNATYYYNFEQRAIGIGTGVDPIADELMISFKGDFYYHFAGKRKYSLIRPWYFSPGLRFNIKYLDLETANYLWVNFKVGREYSFNHSWGMYTELGISLLTYTNDYTNETSKLFEFGKNITPTFGLGVYYRFPLGCNCPKIKTKP